MTVLLTVQMNIDNCETLSETVEQISYFYFVCLWKFKNDTVVPVSPRIIYKMHLSLVL